MRNASRLVISAAVATLALTACGIHAQGQVTTIEMSDKVLVEDCTPFGINLGGDAYYSGAVLRKKRAIKNFEGTSYRQCHFGPVWKENGCSTWFSVTDYTRQWVIGAKYTILSGPSKGTTGIVKDVIKTPYKHQGKTIEQNFFLLDKKIEPAAANGGIMIERMRLEDGQIGLIDDHWQPNLKVSIGDTPPGSFGVAACNLSGTDKRALLRLATHYQRYGQTNGTWQVHFWAKVKSGAPKFRVATSGGEYGEGKDVELTGEWKKFEITLKADKVPEPKGTKDNPHMTIVLMAQGGEVLVDDIEVWMDGDTNPTVFRDDVVNMLKAYGPGAVRYLQMGGNTLDNCLKPGLQAHSFSTRGKTGPYSGHQRTPYSLPEMYELCKYIGAEPWYCLPGTLNHDEMRNFMEYLGGDATTKYGKIRIDQGQEEPWTDVFATIHVEFGNEAWNNAGPYQQGGYNGPDYWNDLIGAGKASPYYKKNVVFHSAGQAASSGRNQGIMANTPNADRHSVAPYIIHSLNQKDMDILDTDEKFFQWAFAWAIRRSRHKDGAMLQNYKFAQRYKKELSIYEVNHHTTHGDAPLEPRNRLVTSLGGGLNVSNNMLMMVKEHNLRTQALFSLVQHSYRAASGNVRLWGTALNMRKGQERYRPTFLACATANRVMRGDLVETVHTGADPKFSATGFFSSRGPQETMENLPVLWSYGFSDEKTRGLIIVNLDVANAQEVAVKFAGRTADGAQSWLLTAAKITDNNEFEQPQPQVKVTEAKLADFQSGSSVTIPAHSMIAVKWELE
jgi:alpha-L-arabinofuranosidase